MASGIATVHGVAYEWSTFEPLDNAIIGINTTPVQSLVAKSGVYSFDLSSGTYLVKATYYQNGTLTHYGEEVITVSDEGNYVVDLLLLPSYTANGLDAAGASQERTGLDPTGSAGGGNGILIGVSLTLILVLLIMFYQVRYKKEASPAASLPRRTECPDDSSFVLVSTAFEPGRPGSSSSFSRESSREAYLELTSEVSPGIALTKTDMDSGLHRDQEFPTEQDIGSDTYPDTYPDLDAISGLNIPETEECVEKVSGPVPADLQKILDILVSQGGRMTQKDMRKRLNYSEGKVSLMLLDLEKRGRIQKFKKGRGNIIFLVEEEK